MLPFLHGKGFLVWTVKYTGGTVGHLEKVCMKEKLAKPYSTMKVGREDQSLVKLQVENKLFSLTPPPHTHSTLFMIIYKEITEWRLKKRLSSHGLLKS